MEPIKQSDDLPVSFPVITVLGKEYALRFTAGAGMRLARRGIDPARLGEISKEWREQGRSIDLMFELLSSMLGQDVDGKWVALGMTAEMLADQFAAAELAELSRAVTQAVKPQPAARTAETSPAPTDPQVQ